MTNEGLQFLTREEGVRLAPYDDSHGYATVGVGHLIGYRGVTHNDLVHYAHFTLADAYELLNQDVKRYEAAVNALGLKLKKYQKDALVSFCYNVGQGGLQSSQLVRYLKTGGRNPNTITDLFHHFDDGGLLYGRRMREARLFNNGDYGPGIVKTPIIRKIIPKKIVPPYYAWAEWTLGEGSFKSHGPKNLKARPKNWKAAVPHSYFSRLAEQVAARKK